MAGSVAPPLQEWMALAQVYHDVAAVIGWDNAVAFGMKVWETKRPPSRARTDSVHGGGRGVIYIPKSIGLHCGSELVQLAGAEDAERLAHVFGGEQLEFPCIVAASIGRRNKAIVQRLKDGMRVADVAFLFDLNERQVRRIRAGFSVASDASSMEFA